MKIYIAGPISEDPDYKAKFDAVAAELEKLGDIPLNPTVQPLGLTYKEYIDNGLEMLKKADGAIFLPGWQKSIGAHLEFEYCTAVSMSIMFADLEKKEEK